MKLECSVEKLKNAILKAERVTGKNLSLPILNSILLIAADNKLKLRATNLSLGVEVEMSAKVLKEGVAASSGQILSNFFNNVYKDETVTLELVNDNLSIKTKNNTALVKNYPHDDFPTLPIVKENSFDMDITRFLDGLKSVYWSAALSDIKPEFASVYVFTEGDNMIFVATDSFRLAEKRIKIKKTPVINGILIPLKNITEIIKLFSDIKGEINICFNKNQASFFYDGIYLTSKLVNGTFPDYRQIIPKEQQTEVVSLKQDLINAIRISNIFSDKFNQIVLDIKPKEKLFSFYSKNADVGENRTKIDAAIQGEPVEINLNYKYFLDCLQSITSDSLVIKLNGSNKPIIVKGVADESFTYLIMPMNR